ncbi:hypothetical protein [Thalassobaculum litoreum]|uniref:Uncharacterized protein n=1 Tax=Thalassobaculum litoreum DSM 18839 TaxID=1123362 RepID=A0A8G2BN72_9PROT|nr:hypothetical protein [Thalassobaculum litoreum]SDG60095.1 hypothetical protein SAMN05660686_04986 [Thalassobaculum litoreum DSM 18839]
MNRKSLSEISWVFISTAICIFLLISRQPEQIGSPQIWAEDGTVFLQQHQRLGFSALLEPYAGYLHLFPRLGAAAAGLLPIEWTPAIYAALSVLATAWVAVIVHLTRLTATQRVLFVVLFVAIPHQGEVFLNLTNAQWILCLSLIAALLCDPDRLQSWQFVLLWFTVAIVSATGPFSVLLAPVWIASYFTMPRSRRRAVLLLTLLVVAAVQFGYLIDNPRVDPVIAQALPVGGSFVQAVGHFFHDLLFHFLEIEFWVIALAAVLLAATLSVGLVSSDRQGLHDMGVLLISAAVIYTSALYSFRSNPTLISAFGGGARYFFVPYVCLAWALVLIVTRASWQPRLLSLICLVLLLGSAASQWRAGALERFAWVTEADLSSAEGDLIVPINPPGWHVTLRKQQP